MSSIYLHIPFCRKKCNYCNFHFSTNLTYKDDLLKSIQKELILRKEEITQPIKTLYFGGGTPSLLNIKELESIFEIIQKNYDLSSLKEITLESNPDNLSKKYLQDLKSYTPINRLSIGIQSFNEEDLVFMNRAHNNIQAENSILYAQGFGFENITIDLIYGTPGSSDETWIYNLNKAINLKIPHISSYALTVEPKTVLNNKIKKGLLPEVDEETQFRQFKILQNILKENGFIQYEFSNFGKEGFFSKHNQSYWNHEDYMGIGPSAHSFNGKNTRSWNVSNNIHYIKSLKENIPQKEEEIITEKDFFNEKIMLSLRTIKGVNIDEIEQFSLEIKNHFQKELNKLLKENLTNLRNNNLTINPDYLFQTDGIISRLFYID